MKRIVLIFFALFLAIWVQAQKQSLENSFVKENDSLFFPQGSTWKYLDDGTDQGTEWQELNFDDSEWGIGQGHMGFGEGDETTLLTPGYITYYFRKVVDVPDVALLDSIYFSIVHDDGAVVYINGVEVIRSALMPEGPINYQTGTTTYIPNDVENDFWNYQVDKSYFQNGENIIAIEVHNQHTGSSDISFDCYVTDTLDIQYKLDGPYVFYRNDEIVVKSIEAVGAKTYIYQNPENVELICRFQDGLDSFTVQLKPELSIEPSTYELPDKFLAISDIEGNIEAFTMVLKDAGIMNDEYNWVFGDGHLFFVGDMFDRGNNVTECLWLLYRLESQAVEQGGRIHFVMGNHDIMNLIYDFRYVAQKYIENVGLIDESLESIYADDSELGRWLRTKNIIEKAGPFVFVHGGLSPALAALNLSFDEINYWGRYRMDDECETNECNVVNGGSDYGAYWYRGMAEEDLSQDQVNTIVQGFESEMVVVGHTVFDEITLLYEGRVICIDLDHKDNFMSGFMSALYYEDGELFDFNTDGSTQTYTILGEIFSLNEIESSDQGNCLKIQPNPVYKLATISYTVPKHLQNIECEIKIEMYNSCGVLVKSISNQSLQLIENKVVVDMSDLSSGIYCCYVNVESYLAKGKVLIVK